MTKNTKTHSPMRLLLAGVALSATAMAAVPAHAGPLDFLKRAVKQELKETFEEVTESAVETAVETAVVATIGADASNESGGGIYNSGGTLSTQAQVGRGRAKARASVGEAMTSQNGTTVETASEVQAPQGEAQAPRPKKSAEWSRVKNTAAAGTSQPARAKLSQNGTTVETANEVQAQADEQAALLLPAVQSARESARRNRAKLSQNGTTVATANEVQAPETPPAALAGDEHEITYDIAAGVDRTQRKVAPQQRP